MGFYCQSPRPYQLDIYPSTDRSGVREGSSSPEPWGVGFTDGLAGRGPLHCP
uniref:Uncharacterized protein n=1 Tax=Solanum tuberosum TaxID=4113 RepID=M1CYG0_SOLTU